MPWNYPTTIWFGAGKIEELATACLNLKIKSPLFVTDKDLLNLPMTSKVIEKLKKDFDHLQVFSQFSGNPTGKNVMEGVSLYCLLYTSPSPRDLSTSRMPSSA